MIRSIIVARRKFHAALCKFVMVLCAAASIGIALSSSQIAYAQKSSSSPFPIEEFLAAHGDFGRTAKRLTPDIELSSYYIPEAEFDGDDEVVDIFRYELDALIPLPVTRDSFLLFGGHAGTRALKIDSDSGFEDENLYNIGLRLGGGTFVNDDLAIQGYWQPSIYSDLGGPPYSDDWKLWYGAGLAVYRQSDTFFWKGGFLLSDALNSGVIPLAGFSWLFSPGWRIDILAPRQFEVSHSWDQTWDLATGIRVDAEEYTIRQSNPRFERTEDIRLRDVRWYVGVLHKWDSGLSLFGRAGIAAGGKYDWHEHFEGDMESAPFVNLGIGWHFS
jgi:hypothetical protein